MEAQGRPDASLEQKKQELIAFAENAFGVIALNDHFTQVSAAAREVGRQSEFVSLNKLFSKFVHVSSIALNSVVAVEADAGIRSLFLHDGVKLATDALTTIREVIVQHFPLLDEAPLIGRNKTA